jgi:hypothetical protein
MASAAEPALSVTAACVAVATKPPATYATALSDCELWLEWPAER